jgi:hypothetical protein
MKSTIGKSLVIFILFLAMLYLEKPLREFLISLDWEFPLAKMVAGICIRILIILLALKSMQALKMLSFSGIATPFRGKNVQAVVIAFLFIGFGVYSNLPIYQAASLALFLLFLCFVFAVGILEELVFRGLIFPVLSKGFKHQSRPFVKAALLSGLLFGLVHFINLFKQPDNWQGIVSQVFFALSIGVYFSGLLLRTETIWWPILIHALVNFAFGAGILDGSTKEVLQEPANRDWTWSGIIPTALFFTFILGGGLFMLFKSDSNRMMHKLPED